jgi:hypothetical protein
MCTTIPDFFEHSFMTYWPYSLAEILAVSSVFVHISPSTGQNRLEHFGSFSGTTDYTKQRLLMWINKQEASWLELELSATAFHWRGMGIVMTFVFQHCLKISVSGRFVPHFRSLNCLQMLSTFITLLEPPIDYNNKCLHNTFYVPGNLWDYLYKVTNLIIWFN